MMYEKITTGTILIKEGTPLPEGRHLESKPFSKGWGLVGNLDAQGLNRQIHKAGWTLFFLANEVNTAAFGSDMENTTRRAVRKAIRSMKSDRLNCLEIGQVDVNRFLGQCRVSVSAHPRHIQEGMYLFHPKYATEADRIQSAAA